MKPRKPQRNLTGVSDELWKAVRIKAAQAGQNISEFVIDVLTKAVNDQEREDNMRQMECDDD